MVMSKSNLHIKKDKPKINDGGHKPFGVDIDPEKNLCHTTEPDGSQSTFYKGTKMSYDDYVSELEHRFDRKSKGKNANKSIGLFGGWGKGTLKKTYEK